MANRNTIIESLGVYLPEKVVTTEEILRGCRHPVRFPLEQFTGVKSRRFADDGGRSIDLASKAIDTCFAHSRFEPRDVDLIICCSISRYDGPNEFAFEPSLSIRLREQFGLDNALAFDVSNGCVGTFTAILIADNLIKGGSIHRALIVSGECISPLTRTAQQEITSFIDPRLACLTLGDAGVAMILEESTNPEAGFHDIDIYTLGRYGSYCIAKATDRQTGGAIMLTDSIKLSAVTMGPAIRHTVDALDHCGWAPESFQHLIMHQTSVKSLNDATTEINGLFQRRVCHEGNVIFNIADRGNTATTTHFVALSDNLVNNRIQSGDRVVFCTTGSGLNIGTALYTLDDLPDRLRGSGSSNSQVRRHARPEHRDAKPPRIFHSPTDLPHVRVESFGTSLDWQSSGGNAIARAVAASEDCLEGSAYDRSGIDLLIYTGVYRDDFLSEPALAALVAGEVGMNDSSESTTGQRTFAFDVINGALGFLNAVFVASQMIQSRRFGRAMIVAAEVENNSEVRPELRRGIKEVGSAIILDSSPDGSGFESFFFTQQTEYLDELQTLSTHDNRGTFLSIKQDLSLEDHYLDCVNEAIGSYLTAEGLSLTHINVIIPPQISASFITRLSAALGEARRKFIDVTDPEGDLFSSSIPYALQAACQSGRVRPGDLALIVGVGSGIQVGCALYRF